MRVHFGEHGCVKYQILIKRSDKSNNIQYFQVYTVYANMNVSNMAVILVHVRSDVVV